MKLIHKGKYDLSPPKEYSLYEFINKFRYYNEDYNVSDAQNDLENLIEVLFEAGVITLPMLSKLLQFNPEEVTIEP